MLSFLFLFTLVVSFDSNWLSLSMSERVADSESYLRYIKPLTLRVMSTLHDEEKGKKGHMKLGIHIVIRSV